MGTTTLETELKETADQHEEVALALAQAAMEQAMKSSGLRRTDLAKRLGVSRPFITKMLRGDYNLTVKSMARVFAACGLELRFLCVKTIKWQPRTPPSNPRGTR